MFGDVDGVLYREVVPYLECPLSEVVPVQRMSNCDDDNYLTGIMSFSLSLILVKLPQCFVLSIPPTSWLLAVVL